MTTIMQRCITSESSACVVIILLTMISLLPLLVALDRTPLPWIDEVLWASTSISVMNGHSATPAVLQAFHNTGRFDLFYGPVAIRLGVAWLKLLGVSMWKWRLLCFTGGLFVIVLAGTLVNALGGSRFLTVTAICLVAFSTPMGSAINSGRLDTIAVALQLCGLTCLVLSVQRKGFARCVLSIAAGVAIAAALLSTPRSLTFCMGLACGGVGLLYFIGLKDCLQALLPATTVAITATSVWTCTEDLSPWRWLRLVSRASVGDPDNVSPLLGGDWGFKEAFFLPAFATIVLLVFVACCLGWLWLQKQTRDRTATTSPELVFVLIVGLANAALTIALLSRALSYEVFFVVPLVCGLLVLSAKFLGSTTPVATSRIVLSAWILFALVGIAVRTIKLVDVYADWSSRDPQPLRVLISNNIPAGSLVLGLDPVYFWAVQESNARYLWIKEVTTPGLNSGGGFDPQSTLQELDRSRAFLLWKDNEPLPSAFSSLIGKPTVTVRMETSEAGVMHSLRPRSMTASYPPAHLYSLSLLNVKSQ